MAYRGTGRRDHPFPQSTYERFARKLYQPLRLGENSVILCPPLYGRDHIVLQLWERPALRERILGPQARRFTFGNVQLANAPAHAERIWGEQMLRCVGLSPGRGHSFAELLAQGVDDGAEYAFCINVPETLDDERFSRFLAFAQATYYAALARIHLLLIVDMRWDEASFLERIAPYRSLFQNTVLLPQYTDEETAFFVHFLARRWELALSPRARDAIVGQAGGIRLLAKALVRIAVKYAVKKPDAILRAAREHPEFLFQMKLFLSCLTQLQRQTLTAVANGQPTPDAREFAHLCRMDIIRNTIAGASVRSKAVLYALQSDASRPIVLSAAVRDSGLLSRAEQRVLLALLAQKSTVVPRDEIATILRQGRDGDAASDWAIDKAISRIRKKLPRIPALSTITILTKKRSGFFIL